MYVRINEMQTKTAEKRKLTYIEIPFEIRNAMSFFVVFEIRLHVSYLYVSFVRIQYVDINDI